LDLHIQAFRLAEQLSCPVMVCMDGFILTHAVERIEIPDQATVDAYLPPFEPVQVLDPAAPHSIGAMVGPEAFTEVRYLEHQKQLRALELIPNLAAEFKSLFGRDSGGLLKPYRNEDAGLVVIALGSVNGTIKDVVDEMRDDGHAIGSLGVTSFRPWPLAALRQALEGAKRIVVLEKSLVVGMGGVVSANVRMALRGLPIPVHTVIAGLGGRPIPKRSLHAMLRKAEAGALEDLHFLDLKEEIVGQELERIRTTRRSGPTAEAVLRHMGGVKAGAV
ncbi:MAG: hypothetical protein K2Q10_02050, partial [Rhodospirillales bacterium]|nr:hypothetical protein [Rhodospirillales bacterium]